MALARHGSGPRATFDALASQVHPVFMLPPVAAAWFGGVLAGHPYDPRLGAIHALAVFCAVYTAHVKDGLVDFHVRGEDDDHPLTVTGCRVALVGAAVLFAGCLVALWFRAGASTALLTLPTWVIGYLHAPHLDTNPVTTTVGYPLGIALAILGGYDAQAATLAAAPVAFAAVFVLLLSGVKIVDDAQDYAYDRAIRKRTVAVALGRSTARRLAFGLLGVALVAVLGFAAGGVFPPSTALAVGAFGLVATAARRADPTVATMLLIRGSYVFLALLVAAVWFRPLA